MNNKQGINWAEIEPLCVIKLLLRKLWLLVLAFLIGFMSVTIVLNGLVTHSYSCSAIFAVTARTAYSTNTSAATEVVNIYTELLQGRFMDELIRQDLGITDGTLSASQVDDTNLITLTVTSNSPKNALLIMQSVMNNYHSLSDYISSTAVLNPLNTPNISIITNNAYNVPKYSRVAGLICAALMAAAVVWLGLSRGTVQSTAGAKNNLDARIIASIPHENTKHSVKSASRKHRRKNLRVSSPNTSFAFTEAIHNVASRLEHEQSKGKKVFLFTSVTEGEGKSTVAVNAALALAAAHSRVLFIDLDLRRPVQADFLEVRLGKNSGFGDMLLSGADAGEILSSAAVDPATGMEMLLSSRSYTEMIDLLSSPLLARVIAEARERFDYVVIDSPPLGYFSDSEVLSDLADGTLLIVRQDLVPAAEINDAIDALRACRAEFLGCILNDMQHLSSRLSGGRYAYGYGYGYGKYGKYGYGKYGKYGYGRKSEE